jgi:hypothetical protein
VAVVIKADCPECGVVRLGTRDVTVRVYADDGSGAYSFRCRHCGAAVSQPADADTCDLLRSAGVRAVEWRLPDELEQRPSGPAFTFDDLLDFHLLLRGEQWDAHVAALVDAANRTN